MSNTNPHIAGKYAVIVALIGVFGTLSAVFLKHYLDNKTTTSLSNNSNQLPNLATTKVQRKLTQNSIPQVETAKDDIVNLEEFLTRKLPCGVEMNISRLGVENQLIDFIQNDKALLNKTAWFNFDHLTFASGSVDLDMAKSGEEIDNIAQILKCFPKVSIKLGGYTDDTGSVAGSMKLSAVRAAVVKAAIVAKVIAASRITTEGYGSVHPIASNDTEEGRAQNRRIALRVEAK